MPYGHKEIGQQLMKLRFVAWEHQTITWNNANSRLLSAIKALEIEGIRSDLRTTLIHMQHKMILLSSDMDVAVNINCIWLKCWIFFDLNVCQKQGMKVKNQIS